MNEFKNLESVKNKHKQSVVLANLETKYKEEIKKPSCDKYGFGFGVDTRFTIFKVTLNLCGYTGYYGDSSCSRIAPTLENSFMSELLQKALNKNLSFILQEMADIGKAEAISGIEKAKKELEDALLFIENIKYEAEKPSVSK